MPQDEMNDDVIEGAEDPFRAAVEENERLANDETEARGYDSSDDETPDPDPEPEVQVEPEPEPEPEPEVQVEPPPPAEDPEVTRLRKFVQTTFPTREAYNEFLAYKLQQQSAPARREAAPKPEPMPDIDENPIAAMRWLVQRQNAMHEQMQGNSDRYGTLQRDFEGYRNAGHERRLDREMAKAKEQHGFTDADQADLVNGYIADKSGMTFAQYAAYTAKRHEAIGKAYADRHGLRSAEPPTEVTTSRSTRRPGAQNQRPKRAQKKVAFGELDSFDQIFQLSEDDAIELAQG